MSKTARDATVAAPEPVAAAERASERRDHDLTQDTATYNCSCGLVFEAPVQTSVDCPHCGGQQAW